MDVASYKPNIFIRFLNWIGRFKKQPSQFESGLQNSLSSPAAMDAMKLLHNSDPQALKNQNWQVRKSPHKR